MNEPARILDRPERLRLRVEEFELLESSGAFAVYSKAELIDGDIYVVNAQFAHHARAKVRLLVALSVQLQEMGSDVEVLSEVSLRTAADSMPEPDLLLARQPEYGPVPVDMVPLVVEISDSTLTNDLGRKSDMYAAAGISEYWVVDLQGGRVIVREDPAADGYRRQRHVPFGETLCSSAIDGLAVETGRLFSHGQGGG